MKIGSLIGNIAFCGLFVVALELLKPAGWPWWQEMLVLLPPFVVLGAVLEVLRAKLRKRDTPDAASAKDGA